MRVYTVEECQRKADYYRRLFIRTNHESLSRQYWLRMAMWEEWVLHHKGGNAMTTYTSEYCGKMALHYVQLAHRAEFPLHMRMYDRRSRLWWARQTEARANGR